MSDSVALHLPILATVLLPFAAALLGLGVAHRSVVKDLTVIAGFLALVSAGYRLWTIDGPVVGSDRPSSLRRAAYRRSPWVSSRSRSTWRAAPGPR